MLAKDFDLIAAELRSELVRYSPETPEYAAIHRAVVMLCAAFQGTYRNFKPAGFVAKALDVI